MKKNKKNSKGGGDRPMRRNGNRVIDGWAFGNRVMGGPSAALRD